METKFTIQFDGWAPDLGNVSMQMPGPQSPLVIPCADVLNVYYQDGAYRCIPSPVSQGVTLPNQVLSAFTYYDFVGAQEIIFAGDSGALYSVDNGFTSVPIEASVTVFGTGLPMSIIVKGTIVAKPVHLNMAVGSGVARGGRLYNGTINTAFGSSQSGNVGFISGVMGSISPAALYQPGATITALYSTNIPITNTHTTTLVIAGGNFGQSFFTTLTLPTVFTILSSSTAAYSTFVSGGRQSSQWVWQSMMNVSAPYSFPFQLIA